MPGITITEGFGSWLLPTRMSSALSAPDKTKLAALDSDAGKAPPFSVTLAPTRMPTTLTFRLALVTATALATVPRMFWGT